LELLEEKKEMHLSAEDIYKKLLEAGEDVGLATVYRVLTQFEQASIVVKNNFEEGRAVYELHHDQHHDHMVCVKTGKIIEFHDEIIEQRQSDVAKDLGYDIVDHSMVLYVEPIKK
jgi:Fur family ferric uptake transcriptional regulator